MSNEALIALVKKNPVGVLCALLSLALFGGWYYRSGDVPDTEQVLQQKSAEAERYSANLSNASQLKEQFDLLVAANKEIDSRLLHARDSVSNIQYFYKLEKESGVKLTSDPRQAPISSQKKDAAKGACQPLAFSVSVQGDLTQVLNFLGRLESGAHYCRVLGFTCTAPQVRSQPLSVSMNLELLGLP
jgi:hypothetical protein